MRKRESLPVIPLPQLRQRLSALERAPQLAPELLWRANDYQPARRGRQRTE
jgi:hypothetical protein